LPQEENVASAMDATANRMNENFFIFKYFDNKFK
jgi:hypothetical protein